MDHNRSTKVLAIVALVAAVLGLSIGFSAYSKVLNIQNVQATVAGDPTKFDVILSTSSTSALTGTVTGFASGRPGDNSAGTAILKDTTISDLTGTFSSAGSVNYQFYVYNKGLIPAYLTGITFGEKTCTGTQGTDNELASAICDDIEVRVQIGIGNEAYSSTKTNITDSKELSPGKSEIVNVQIIYTAKNSVNGIFTAKFGDITLMYSSQTPTS